MEHAQTGQGLKRRRTASVKGALRRRRGEKGSGGGDEEKEGVEERERLERIFVGESDSREGRRMSMSESETVTYS